MNKVVFLDRDGTINVDYGYVHDPEQLVFMPGALASLKRIREQGFRLIIVTNQSGIGRGYFSKEEYARFNKAMQNRMAENGVVIDRIYTCPHIAEDRCNCRKPLTGLFEEAITDFDVDVKNSYAIGDRLRDLSVCKQYPIQGILYIPEDEGQGLYPEDQKAETETMNIVRKRSWEEIAEYICR